MHQYTVYAYQKLIFVNPFFKNAYDWFLSDANKSMNVSQIESKNQFFEPIHKNESN